MLAVPTGTTLAGAATTRAGAATTRAGAAPLRTRAVAAILLGVAAVALTACDEAPAPTAAPIAPERCLPVGGNVLSLAWSQTGAFVAVGGTDPGGTPFARVVTVDGSPFGEVVVDRDLNPFAVVVDPTGNLAWKNTSGIDSLVERRPEGRRQTPLPASIVDIGWTAVGYALLEASERADDPGGRVLLLDPDRPDDLAVIHETERHPTGLWISGDPEQLLLWTARVDGRGEVVVGFEVAGSTATTFIEPAGADVTGASMPSLRRHVVFRTVPDRRIHALDLARPEAIVALDDRPAGIGAISDGGILALAVEEPAGTLCLVDVAAKLP